MKTQYSARHSILIKNANIVNEGKSGAGDVLIRRGRIDRISGFISANADIVIDAAGKALLPGMIDCHTHFREPGLTHKGDMATESAAAVAGGVTSVMEMPNTSPPAVTNERVEEKFELAAGRMRTNYSFYLGASLNNLDEIKAVDRANVCGVKVYMGSSTGDMFVDRLQTLDDLFRECPVNLTAHCENSRIISQNEKTYREKYGDSIPFSAHPLIRSREACYESSKMAVELAHKHETRLHILHISTADELDLFDSSRVRIGTAGEGEMFDEPQTRNITGEACVHHLFFDDSAYETKGALVKCNPAIKTAADRTALLKALVSNRLATIGTDHAPHTFAEKQRPYAQAPSGIPVIQSALPSVLEHFHDDILSLELIAEKTAHNPARIFNVTGRGFIREGYWADLVLVDLNRPQTVCEDNILYKCGWSPFEGVPFRSSIDTTIVSGQIAWQNNKIVPPARGQRLAFSR